MRYIERTRYLERLKRLKNTPDIKIITGLRRSGKSELMLAYIQELRKEERGNIIFIDFFDLEFEGMKDYKALHSYVQKHYLADCRNYLLIDEVQLCPQFELAVNSLHNSGKFDIYITGSNAFLLSSDLATLFTGRFIEISVFPFSFEEYCRYFQKEAGDPDRLFDRYTLEGGLAGSYVYADEQDRADYIREVYKTVVTRDLVSKYHLSEAGFLEHLTEFEMDNIGNLTSPNKISSGLSAQGIPANHVTVRQYLKYLCRAFMFYEVRRYDIKGKRYLETSSKFYLSDLGFRYAVLGARNLDYGRTYENIVFLELLRRGYDVYIGKLYQKEVDFIAQRGSDKIYIQVSDNISEKDTFLRETAPLLQIRDAYPKMLLARTRHNEYLYEGIRVQDLPAWLLHE